MPIMSPLNIIFGVIFVHTLVFTTDIPVKPRLITSVFCEQILQEGKLAVGGISDAGATSVRMKTDLLQSQADPTVETREELLDDEEEATDAEVCRRLLDSASGDQRDNPVLTEANRRASAFTGTLGAVTAFLAFFSNPLWGRVSDYAGRKPLLLMAQAGGCLQYLVIYLYPSQLSFTLSAVLEGAFAVGFLMTFAALTDISPPGELAVMIGRSSAAAGLALIVGPLTGIGLGKIDLTIVYLVGACLDLVNMAFTWKYYPDTSAISNYRLLHTEPDEADDIDGVDELHSSSTELLNRANGSAVENSQRVKRGGGSRGAMDDDPSAPPVSREFPGFLELFRTSNPLSVMGILLETPFLKRLSIAFLFMYIQFGTLSIWQLFTNQKFGWGLVENGLFIMLFGLSSAASQGLALKPLLNFLGVKTTIVAGFVIRAASMFGIAFSTSAPVMFLMTITSSLGSVSIPAMRSEMIQEIAQDRQGGLQGGLSALATIGRFIGSLASGQVLAYFISPKAPIYFPGAPFVGAASLLLMAIVPIIYAFRVSHHSHGRKSAARGGDGGSPPTNGHTHSRSHSHPDTAGASAFDFDDLDLDLDLDLGLDSGDDSLHASGSVSSSTGSRIEMSDVSKRYNGAGLSVHARASVLSDDAGLHSSFGGESMRADVGTSSNPSMSPKASSDAYSPKDGRYD